MLSESLMKICVIELAGVDVDLFGDERLANLRRLMDVGLYGKLKPGGGAACDRSTSARLALWPSLAGACRQALMMGGAQSSQPGGSESISVSATARGTPLARWTIFIDQLMNPDWDYLHFVDCTLAPRGNTNHVAQSPESDFSLVLDEQIGRVLEMLDDQTALLIIGCLQAQDHHGFFLLAAPNCPISGEYEAACLYDLAPTLLDLAGLPSPHGHRGQSLVAGLEKRSPNEASVDHERIVLDRLAGLGYV